MLLVLEKEDSLFLCSRPKHMDFGARKSCLWNSSSGESWVLPLQSKSNLLCTGGWLPTSHMFGYFRVLRIRHVQSN